MSITRIIYFWVKPWDPLKAGLVAAYSLLLSNSIRRDTLVVIDTVYRGVETRLMINGRIRHLRLDEDSLRGLMEKAVRGKIGRVRVTKPSRVKHNVCLSCVRDGVCRDSVSVVSVRRFSPVPIIVSWSNYIRCAYCIAVDACKSLPPWLSVGVLQLMLDRVLPREHRERRARDNLQSGKRGT